MDERNNLSKIKNIPVELGDYHSGPWGCHQPPNIIDGKIIFNIGLSPESNDIKHGQNIYIIEVNNEERLALVAIIKYGAEAGSGYWMYLIGNDLTSPWIYQVPPNLVKVADAVEFLKPSAVKKAEQVGLKVLNRGNCFLSQ